MLSETTAGLHGEYTITRTSAMDDVATPHHHSTITVEDATAPEFTAFPQDYTVECSDEMPMDDATATNRCSGVSIRRERNHEVPGNYTIIRTFTATDDCGSTSATKPSRCRTQLVPG